MARLRPKRDRERLTALGSGIVEVHARIRTLADRVAHAMVPWPFTQMDVLETLYPPEIIAQSIALRPWLTDLGSYQAYRLSPMAYVRLDFEHMLSAPLNPDRADRIAHASATGDAIHTTIQEITAIYDKFAVVKAVANWLNANATIGAIRYYWPTMASLCGHEGLRGDTPASFKEPLGLAPWLPLLRESASTVASALMLGDQPWPNNKMLLTLSQRALNGPAGIRIEADSVSLFVGSE